MARGWRLQFFTTGLHLASSRARDPRQLELEIQIKKGGRSGCPRLKLQSHRPILTWCENKLHKGMNIQNRYHWRPLWRLGTTELNRRIKSILKYSSYSLSSLLTAFHARVWDPYSPLHPHVLNICWNDMNEWELFFTHVSALRDGRTLREHVVYGNSLHIKDSWFVSRGAKNRFWHLNSPFSVLATSSLKFSLCNLELSLTQNLVALLINHLSLQLCLLCHCLSSTSIEIFSNAFI